MIDVCWGCGGFTPEKRIRPGVGDDASAVAVCPDCGHEHPFPYRPLVAVCGPSGAGKTTVLRRLLGRPVAGEAALRERLADRPDWRGTGPEFVAEQADYDRVLRERATDDPQLTVLDTADRGVEATVDRVGAWMTAALEA